MSKEEYARKRTCNGRSVRIENSVTRDNCSASLGKPRDAEQLPRDGIFSPYLTAIKESSEQNQSFCTVLPLIVLHEISILVIS